MRQRQDRPRTFPWTPEDSFLTAYLMRRRDRCASAGRWTRWRRLPVRSQPRKGNKGDSSGLGSRPGWGCPCLLTRPRIWGAVLVSLWMLSQRGLPDYMDGESPCGRSLPRPIGAPHTSWEPGQHFTVKLQHLCPRGSLRRGCKPHQPRAPGILAGSRL